MPILQIVIASIRPGRLSPVIARWFAELAREHGAFEVQLVDLAEVAFPVSDEPPHAADADASVFVMSNNDYAFASAPKNDDVHFERQYKLLGSLGDDSTSPIPVSVTVDDPVRSIEHGRFLASEAMENSANAMLDELWRLTSAQGALYAQAS